MWDGLQAKFMASGSGQENVFGLLGLINVSNWWLSGSSVPQLLTSWQVWFEGCLSAADCIIKQYSESKIITAVASLDILSSWIQPHYEAGEGSWSSSSSVLRAALPKRACPVCRWRALLMRRYHTLAHLVISRLALLLYCTVLSERPSKPVYTSSDRFWKQRNWDTGRGNASRGGTRHAQMELQQPSSPQFVHSWCRTSWVIFLLHKHALSSI